MATLSVRTPDDKHLRLKELSTVALVEFDTHTRFKLMAARGDVAENLG